MREYELQVLDQYDIEIISTRKARGAYFCETNEGAFLLKEAGISGGKAPLMRELLFRLESIPGIQTDTPVLNKDGEVLSVLGDGTKYILKKWFCARECDVRRERDILDAAANLARLHLYMNWKDIGAEEEIRIPTGRRTLDELRRHNRELKKVRAFMRGRVAKTEFEYRFLENFEKMYAVAERVTERMESSGYPTLHRESIEKQLLVHGDYNYHNVLFTQGRTATTNFEHFRVDIQAQDLYYFLRKVMEKHQWNVHFGRQLLDAYQNVRPLDVREKEFIALCLAYPEKFWKTANAYSNSNKAWIPEKSVEKLETAVGQLEEKEQFLENLFTFHL